MLFVLCVALSLLTVGLFVVGFFFSYFVLFVFIVVLVGPVWYCDDLQLLGKRELATLLFSDRLYSVTVALLDIFKIILPPS